MNIRYGSLAVLLACGSGSKDSGVGPDLTESEYLAEYPALFCGVLEQCDPDVFLASYANELDACIDEITTVGRDRINQGCAFDGAAAAACVNALQGATCDGWADGDYQETCGSIIEC